MEFGSSVSYAELLCPGLDPDEFRLGQLLAILAAVSALLLMRLYVLLC